MHKIIIGFNSFFMMLFYFFLNFFSRKSININDPKLIVSLTCFPARINKVFFTIESIFNQKCNFNYEVRLYLSKDEFPCRKLPSSLKRLENRNLKIFFVDGNLKSYKKLIYAYDNEGKLPVVTADDDIFYPKSWLSCLYSKHLTNPEFVIFFRGRVISFTNDFQPDLYFNFKLSNQDDNGFLCIPTGVSGILYPCGCFHSDWNNIEKILKLAPTADDLWFKVMTLLNNRYSLMASKQSIHFTPVLGTQFISLNKINVNNGYSENDTQFNALLDHYKINLIEYLG